MAVISDFMKGLDDPNTLFRHFHVTIAGGGVLESGSGTAQIRRFKVSDKNRTVKGFTTGLSGFFNVKKNRPRVFINLLGGKPNGQPDAKQGEFDAYYIPMVQTSSVKAGASHYILPTNGNVKLVLTSQLSACSFGIGSDAGGAVLVSHMQPNPNVGKSLEEKVGRNIRMADLQTNMHKGFDDVQGKVKGVISYGDQYKKLATIIGKLDKAKWKFYMQAGSKPTIFSHQIDSVSVI